MSAAFREELLNELFTNPKGAGKKRRRLIEKNFKTGRVKITKSYWEGVVIKRVSKAVGKRKGGKHEQFEMDSKAWDALLSLCKITWIQKELLLKFSQML